jgi:hypothetical protein
MSLLRTNKHRRNRRATDPGNKPTGTPFTPVVTNSTTVATITSPVPLTVKKMPALAITGRTNVSYTTPTPYTVQITTNSTNAGLAWSLPANDPGLITYQGGRNVAASGTF